MISYSDGKDQVSYRSFRNFYDNVPKCKKLLHDETVWRQSIWSRHVGATGERSVLTLLNYFSCQTLGYNFCLTKCPFCLPNFETLRHGSSLSLFTQGETELVSKVGVPSTPLLKMKLQQFSSTALSLFTGKQYSESYHLEISSNTTIVPFFTAAIYLKTLGKQSCVIIKPHIFISRPPMKTWAPPYR